MHPGALERGSRKGAPQPSRTAFSSCLSDSPEDPPSVVSVFCCSSASRTPRAFSDHSPRTSSTVILSRSRSARWFGSFFLLIVIAYTCTPHAPGVSIDASLAPGLMRILENSLKTEGGKWPPHSKNGGRVVLDIAFFSAFPPFLKRKASIFGVASISIG